MINALYFYPSEHLLIITLLYKHLVYTVFLWLRHFISMLRKEQISSIRNLKDKCANEGNMYEVTDTERERCWLEMNMRVL